MSGTVKTKRPDTTGFRDVEIDGIVRGFVVRNDDGQWESWLYRHGRRNVKPGVPLRTMREAGGEIAIQWESYT
jgi:hypothetical protein